MEFSALHGRIRVQELIREPNPKSWLTIDVIPLGISPGFIGEGLKKKQEGAQIQEAFKLKNIWLLSSEVSNRETLSFPHDFWSVS